MLIQNPWISIWKLYLINWWKLTLNGISNVYSSCTFSWILTLNNNLDISWDLILKNWSTITHSEVATSLFNLQISWTLEIETWAKIDVSWKWISANWAWSSGVWWTYGWYGVNSTKTPYWDIYNPIYVWSYWTNTSYQGWWLVRITTSNLINNWSILANWFNTINYWAWSWWWINITVNWALSWSWIYQANWWSAWYNWWGWRIAIKYWSVDNIETIKTKVFATWPWLAWEWTIYLKNNTNWNDYLLIKWNWDNTSTNKKTWVWTWLSDYYFDVIESASWAVFDKIWIENVVSPDCRYTWVPQWLIWTGINCWWVINFKYYDLWVSIRNFSIKNRKYEYLITSLDWWASFVWTSTWVINWNWDLTMKFKITKTWNYTFTFNLYDSDLIDAEIRKSVTKTITVWH